jgi:hypothetical protein
LRRAAFRGDVAIAVLIVLFILLILQPGLAWAAVIAIVLFVGVAVSLLVTRRSRTRGKTRVRRSRR